MYDIVYDNEVYPSRYHMNNPKYLWWKFEPINQLGDTILQNNKINYELYFNWRNSIYKSNKISK